jgi:hypothetical protein
MSSHSFITLVPGEDELDSLDGDEAALLDDKTLQLTQAVDGQDLQRRHTVLMSNP